jgi:hypothetical protein
MRINNYTFENRNDFHANLVCEHCGHMGELRSGYHDSFYYTQVIPSILCARCNKNRDGTATPREGVNGAPKV